ncbi:hypothetical protein EG835_01915 [bacterium]|nr:hypothetical protein [bacterium]
MRRHLIRLALALLVPAALISGCSGTTTPPRRPPTTPPAEETTAAPGTDAENGGDLTQAVVYLMRDDEKVHPVRREVDGPAVATAALEALLAGPTAQEIGDGSSSSVPEGTRLLGVTIDAGVATVDLSSEFASGGGSLSMMSRVAQVVFTATQFSTVESVLFEMEGEPLDVLGGEGIILEGPQTRAQWETFAPVILVEKPVRGDSAVMGEPLRVSGSANVFEAQFTLEVTDGDGLIVVTEPVMATSGSGERGTFDVTVTPGGGKPGNGAVIVSYKSAKDGSRVVIDEVPIVFE